MVNLGVMATITQSIDAETAIKVAEAFGKKVYERDDTPTTYVLPVAGSCLIVKML